jgi:hypothetical protein
MPVNNPVDRRHRVPVENNRDGYIEITEIQVRIVFRLSDLASLSYGRWYALCDITAVVFCAKKE